MFDSQSTGFLSALQLADSFFPTGMYAHSHGLEGMAARGSVSNAGDVAAFLKDQLLGSLLPGDGVALVNAHRSAGAGDLESLAAIDRLLLALKLPQEQRNASAQMGRRLLAETAGLTAHPVHAEYRRQVVGGTVPGNGAVALGVTTCVLDIPEGPALLLFCHSHIVSVLGAALRLLPLSHSDAQAILHNLQPLVAGAAPAVRETPWQEMAAFCPAIDIASMDHEAQDLRLFAS